MRLLTIIVAVIGLTFVSVQTEANVLQNSGFEEGDLSGWNTWDVSGSAVTSPIHSGSYALDEVLVSGKANGGYLQNLIDQGMSTGDPLYGNVWIKTDALSNANAYLKVEFLDDSWNVTGDPLQSSLITGTTDWTEVSVFGSIPANTTKANYILMLSSDGSGYTGNAYFDDAYADINPVPEPASLVLFGTGLMGLLGLSKRKKRN